MTARYHKSLVLGVYSCSHGMVDAACAALAFGLVHLHPLSSQQFISLIIAYNLLAFGTQVVFGWFVDRLRIYRLCASSGIALAALALVVMRNYPVPAIVMAGAGNALFHVAGGAVSLALTPRRAAAPGIFVAPGALGILIGAFIGRSGAVTAWPFLVILGILLLALVLLQPPTMNYDEPVHGSAVRLPVLFGALLLFSIAVRSFAGFGAGFPYQSNHSVIFWLVLAAFAGKAFGGVLSDRFGWLAVSVSALVISIPLISFGWVNPVIAVCGMLLLQATMPVTLAALKELFPNQGAFTFGLASLALMIGAAPLFSGLKPVYGSWYLLMVLTTLSAASLYAALKLLPENIKKMNLEAILYDYFKCKVLINCLSCPVKQSPPKIPPEGGI
jgi:MFS transporter, FSR family, fosmidomycin resistance protein